VSGWADLSAQNGFEIIAIGAEGGAHGGTRPATAAERRAQRHRCHDEK
jgi:hypothetical protein